MGEGGGTGNGQSRVEKMLCPMYRNVQDGLRSKVRLICKDRSSSRLLSTVASLSTRDIFSSADAMRISEASAIFDPPFFLMMH